MSQLTEPIPYCLLSNSTIDSCCEGCDKPGLGSKDHDPSQNSCSDCALVCYPCAIIADLLCCPYRTYFNLRLKCLSCRSNSNS